MSSAPADEGGNVLYSNELARVFTYWDTVRPRRTAEGLRDNASDQARL